MANLEESRCDITIYEACDTLWLVKLRAFLILVMGKATGVQLTFTSPMATFDPEQVEAIEVSPQYNLHLTLVLDDHNMQNIAALMDGLLFILRPTTLTLSCTTYYVVKYLCENLRKEQLIRPCWMHQLEDFHVECPLNVPVTKKNLAAFPEECHTLITEHIRFKFHWCFN
ncbi:uncharacterized protein LOC141616492 [Silene latifolia]|uniref:uncharacterized protein LOC141616492 n=1 Tax=Silene latifolia TaxID=37657 RepID=UPI003D781BC2